MAYFLHFDSQLLKIIGVIGFRKKSSKEDCNSIYFEEKRYTENDVESYLSILILQRHFSNCMGVVCKLLYSL